MNNKPNIYCIQFINNGKNYQLFARKLNQSNVFGFVEISDFIFSSKSDLVIDPSEEKLKTEFQGVSRSYIPIQSVIRIDEVTEKINSSKITDLKNNVTIFPFLSKRP
ncbi:MAG: DUF1820 family protein [Enterobacterales bacterium]